MSGPPTVSVAVVWYVVLGGSPLIDAPAGTAAPMSRRLGPLPTAGPPRSWKSTRGLVTLVVFARCGSAVRLPVPATVIDPALAIDRLTVNVPVGGFWTMAA